MRRLVLALTALAVLGLGACTSSGEGGSGLSGSFDLDNYRRSNDTNGTQTRRDVNRAFTQPSLPTIGRSGY